MVAQSSPRQLRRTANPRICQMGLDSMMRRCSAFICFRRPARVDRPRLGGRTYGLY